MDEIRPRFMSFAEATAWAMEQVTNGECFVQEGTGKGTITVSFDEAHQINEANNPRVEENVAMMEAIAKEREEIQEMTKEMEYQNWLFEAGEFQKRLEADLDSAQDLWIAGEQFKSWLVKHEGAWFDVERSMQQVYAHIDSALHFLKIIRGEK